MNRLLKLQEWFATRCDGDWEHQSGIKIETLDNPGWHVRVDLTGTDLAGAAAEPVEVSRDEQDWYLCKVREDVFEGFGGARNLGDILDVFVSWTETSGASR